MSEFKVTYLPSPEFDPKKYHEGLRELLHLVKLQEEMDNAVQAKKVSA
ncbi:hypothetical protein [Desulfosporosinus sp. FKA]|nr:hypothetical protein [Desulfosporosinus sp. FKA]